MSHTAVAVFLIISEIPIDVGKISQSGAILRLVVKNLRYSSFNDCLLSMAFIVSIIQSVYFEHVNPRNA